MRPLPSSSATGKAKWIPSTKKSPALALAVMTLALMLYCAGCAHSSPELNPSVHQGPIGNAVLLTLPAGTVIQVPDDSITPLLRAAFANELETQNSKLVTRTPLSLCTPAYIAERDAAELQLMKRIEELQITQPK
jgi:hypothetical protein